MNSQEKSERLATVARQVAKCTRCPLFNQATNPVPGEGNPDAEIMFIGEAPGFHEDQKGIPFCGAAGRLLDQLLSLIKIKRREVFIGNMIKHRPPGNRDPFPKELEACQGFLNEQIKIIDPKIIVTLGRFSMRKFLPGEYISSIHGQARYVKTAGKKRIVMPMYHPAAALRNVNIREFIEKDFLKIPMFLGKEVKPESPPVSSEEETDGEQLSLV